MQNRLREAWYIGLFDSLPLLRDPMLLVVVSLFSFLPVFFIFVFAGGAIALPALVGAIVLSLAFVGLFIAQSVYFNKHWFRFQDMLVASPVSPISYAIGLSISTLLISSPAVVLSFAVLLIARPIGALEFVAVIGISLVLWIAMVFIGYAIGASTKISMKSPSGNDSRTRSRSTAWATST